MPRRTLTSKGQVTVPKAIRHRLGMETGDALSFEVRPDGVVEVRALKGSLLDPAGSVQPLSGDRVTVAGMDEAIRRGGARR